MEKNKIKRLLSIDYLIGSEIFSKKIDLAYVFVTFYILLYTTSNNQLALSWGLYYLLERRDFISAESLKMETILALYFEQWEEQEIYQFLAKKNDLLYYF